MFQVVAVALVGIALADSYSFNQSEFHVAFSSGLLENSDYFHLTGQLTEQGGTVAAQCANDTAAHKCSHSIDFGKEYSITHVKSELFRNISATIGGQSVVGRATFSNFTGQPKRCLGVEYRNPNGAFLATGPNPPPRPPPAPQCTREFNRTGCEALGNHSCTWCASSDGVHQLCFEKTHTPSDTKAWSCDKVSKMAPEDTFSFNQSEFHVVLTQSSMLEARDFFHLTGQLTDQGGTVSAQCANDTSTRKCSHSIHFGKEYRRPGAPADEVFRNVSATIGGKVRQGHAYFLNSTVQPKRCTWFEYFLPKGSSLLAYLGMGPNPGPPPPPAPQCTSAFSKTDCEALGKPKKSCTWCESSDGVHQLCFVKDHTPSDTKAWSCDKVTLGVIV